VCADVFVCVIALVVESCCKEYIDLIKSDTDRCGMVQLRINEVALCDACCHKVVLHLHAHTRTHAHSDTHPRAHAQHTTDSHTDTDTYTDTDIQIQTHTHTNIHRHAQTHRTHVHSDLHKHTLTHATETKNKITFSLNTLIIRIHVVMSNSDCISWRCARISCCNWMGSRV